ncbi:hypothetical protein CsSME_00038062 [Camellia sinensis var. sinensis]
MISKQVRNLVEGSNEVVGRGNDGVDETSLSKLMSETTMLKSLCLRETQIIDSTLYSFLGSFLEMLDVSDTKI